MQRAQNKIVMQRHGLHAEWLQRGCCQMNCVARQGHRAFFVVCLLSVCKNKVASTSVCKKQTQQPVCEKEHSDKQNEMHVCDKQKTAKNIYIIVVAFLCLLFQGWIEKHKMGFTSFHSDDDNNLQESSYHCQNAS